MSSSNLEKYQTELIDSALSIGALKFGSFVLKSGRFVLLLLLPDDSVIAIDIEKNRVSPYFFNAGLLSSGSLLSAVASAYATVIAQGAFEFDVLFGPAYKGIPLAAATSLLLHRDHGIDIGYAYDRKEAKDHGEGGRMVGASVKGKNVLILDDVMTAGTAVRGSIDLIKKEGGEIVGVVMCLDREEIGPQGNSTILEVDQLLGGNGKVKAIIRMRDLMAWLEKNGRTEDLAKMKEYWDQYGVKSSLNS